MTAVTVAEAEKVISQTDVRDIVFAQGAKILPSLDVKSLDIVEEVGLQQGVDIGLYRVGAGGSFSLVIGQQTFVDQRVADGRNGNGTADVVGKEQDDFSQQDRIGDLSLTTAFFTFQNIKKYSINVL